MESAFRELIIIPWFMQNINGKKTELGNGTVYGPVRKITFFLNPFDIIAELQPGNIFRSLVKNVLKIVKISANLGGITHKSMVSKTTK